MLEINKTINHINLQPTIIRENSWWTMTDAQLGIFEKHVKGAKFLEAFCGNGSLSEMAMEMGAISGVAFDKESKFPQIKGVSFKSCYTKDFPVNGDKYDALLISYPQSHNNACSGLDKLFNISKKVIYIGCNFDSTACGDTNFWKTMITKEVLAVEMSVRNTMIVYGDKPRNESQPGLVLWEELAGLDRSKIYNLPETPIRSGKL